MTEMLTVAVTPLVRNQDHREESHNINPLYSMIYNMKEIKRMIKADKKNMKDIEDNIAVVIKKIRQRIKKL